MKYLIADKDEVLPNIQEGFNKITEKEFNEFLNKSRISESSFNPQLYEIKVGLIIRSTYTNKVMLWSEDPNSLIATAWVKEDVRDLAGYFLLMSNIQVLINDNLDVDTEVMIKSVLMPIGIIKDGGYITIVFNLIIKDEYIGNNISFLDGSMPNYLDLYKLSTFTNQSRYTKLILPTLVIVRSENNES